MMMLFKLKNYMKILDKKILNLIVLLSCFFSVSSAAVNSGEFNIKRIEVTDNFFAVYVAAGVIASDNCEDVNKVVFWRNSFPSGYDSFLSVALAAQMGSKKISMWSDGCKMGPWGKTLPAPVSIVVIAD